MRCPVRSAENAARGGVKWQLEAAREQGTDLPAPGSHARCGDPTVGSAPGVA